MVEYVVYLVAVSGVLLIRFRPRPADKEPGSGIYRTPIFNPIIFCSVTALIVLRSAVAHVLQALLIILIFGTGSIIYRSSWWRKMASPTAVADLG